MRSENMDLGLPRAKDRFDNREMVISGLCPKLLKCKQPRIAAGFDDEVLVSGAARYREGIADSGRSNRFLDLFKFRVVVPSRVVLIYSNILDLEFDLAIVSGIGLVWQIYRAIARISHLQ